MTLRVSVLIATAGRAEEVGRLLHRLAAQSHSPAEVIISASAGEDVPTGLPDGLPVHTVMCDRGSSNQRNAALRALGPTDVVAFLDDDYVPSRYALEGMARAFDAHPHVAGLNGLLLADGIHGPGLSDDEAASLIADRDRTPPAGIPALVSAPLVGLYGCNMAFRRSAIEGLWFDEDLPLYGWQEDVDFAARASRAGIMAKTDGFYGVHRGVKRSRTSGVRFGYSQVANPVYLSRKGSLPWSFSLRLIGRNMASNCLKSVRPEPWIDRRGRLAGNIRALADLAVGRASPRRILEM